MNVAPIIKVSIVYVHTLHASYNTYYDYVYVYSYTIIMDNTLMYKIRLKNITARFNFVRMFVKSILQATAIIGKVEFISQLVCTY